LKKKRFLTSLGASKETYLLRYLLEQSLDSSKIRAEDRSLALISVASNPYGRDLAWEFLRDHWFDYGGGGYVPPFLVNDVSQYFSHESRYQEVSAFFKQHTDTATTRTIQLTLEEIRNNINFVNRHAKDICSFLVNNKF